MPWEIVIAVAENRLSTERSIVMANASRIRVKIPCEKKNVERKKKRERRKVRVKQLIKEDACKAGRAAGPGCGQGSGEVRRAMRCAGQAGPAGVKA